MHVVLDRPLIPQNTGSIARTCAALEVPLHLVGPLGFEITEKAVRRAGLDYWPYVQLSQHSSFESYLSTVQPKKVWLIETTGKRRYSDVSFEMGDALVFGQETKGLDASLEALVPPDQILYIPIHSEGVRSLNLSNAVALVLYEAMRQLNFQRMSETT